jgi:hypothetical protein
MERDLIPPRLAESSDGLLGYFPVLHRDRLYCNLGHRIIAQSIDPDGRWVSGNGVLFDTQVAEEEYVPAAESVVGVPRSTWICGGRERYCQDFRSLYRKPSGGKPSSKEARSLWGMRSAWW